VRYVIFIFSLFLLLFGCASSSAPQQVASRNVPSNNYEPSQTLNRNSNPISEQLDSVIREGSNYIASKIQANTKIGVVNMNSPSINLSYYVIDSVVMHLVNTDNFLVIERSELDTVQREQKYQLSGEVSDNSAISIGKQLGTQMIVTGSILPLGNDYSLRLKIIDVQTAQIIGTRIYTVKPDTVLLSLLKSQDGEPKNEIPQNVIMGDVNIINNNTTTIQGDVYVNMPNGLGW